jgi:hypothetical protein
MMRDTCSLPLYCLRASVLKEFLADMKPVLQDLRNLIHRWNKDCKSVLKRTQFAWIYTSEMKSLQEEVASLYRRVQGLLNLISNGDTRVLRTKAEAERIRQEKQRKMDVKAREKHEAGIRSLLQQILNEKGEEKISAAAISSDTSSWEQLEQELETKGLAPAQVKQLMDPIKKEINSTATPPQQKNLPTQPDKSKHPRRPSPRPASGNLDPTVGPSRNADRSLSPQLQSNDDSGASKGTGYKPPATILVVDRTNGGEHTRSSSPDRFYITSS